MPHRPLRFLDSAAAVKSLHDALGNVGLVGDLAAADAESVPSNPVCWSLTCPWLAEAIELQWHFEWLPDGELLELSRVRVCHQDALIGEVNVSQLLRERLPRSLNDEMSERLVGICRGLTERK